jgi:alanine racemase
MMSRPSAPRAEARVDLDAIRSNVAALDAHAGRASVMAVVKADGYGHGMVPTARAAVAGGATWLGVATIDEALALREAGLTARILAWMITPGERWDRAIAAEVDVSANSVWGIREVSAAAMLADRPARVHLKVDSGLGRAGATRADWPDLVDAALKAEANGYLQLTGIWSHFAYADEPGHPTVAAQVQVFRDAVALAEQHGARPEVRHLANSAATFTLPEAHFDLVRAGIAVYGLSPVPQHHEPAELGLRPAMTLAARLLLVKRVPSGYGVSYAHEYRTATETSLGLVPLGYADGIPRDATNIGPVLVGGRRRTIAGRVCMDQFMLDLGEDPVVAGDEVLVFGPGDSGEPTAEDWARALGTISYEVVSRVGPRIPRTYREIIQT